LEFIARSKSLPTVLFDHRKVFVISQALIFTRQVLLILKLKNVVSKEAY